MNKPLVIVPNKLLNQFRYLHNLFPNKEWSGNLFYTVEGSIKEPEKMKITLQDFLPMHLGTAGSTNYKNDERYTDFIMAKEERIEYICGNLHTHHNMGCFLSQGDIQDLEDNAGAYNYFLSIVTNCKEEFAGKISMEIMTETKESQYYGRDEDGKKYLFKSGPVKEKKIIMYDCTFEVEQTDIDKEFKDLTALMVKKSTVTPVYGLSNTQFHNTGYSKSQIQSHNKPYYQQEKFSSSPHDFSDYNESYMQTEVEEEDMTMEEEFLRSLFCEHIFFHLDFNDFLTKVRSTFKFDTNAVVKHVKKELILNLPKYAGDVQEKKEILIECLAILAEYNNYKFPFIQPIMTNIEETIKKL